MCELLPVLCELFISQFDFELLLLFYILSGQTKLYIYIFFGHFTAETFLDNVSCGTHSQDSGHL